jgi:hypothetical protein
LGSTISWGCKIMSCVCWDMNLRIRTVVNMSQSHWASPNHRRLWSRTPKRLGFCPWYPSRPDTAKFKKIFRLTPQNVVPLRQTLSIQEIMAFSQSFPTKIPCGRGRGEREREAAGSTERDRNDGKKSLSSEVVVEEGRGGDSGSLAWGWMEEREVELWLRDVVGMKCERRVPSLFIIMY